MTEPDKDPLDLSWTCYRTFEECADLWRAFQTGAVRTVFQRYEWLAANHDLIEAQEGVEPRIVVGSRDGEPRLILPLCLTRRMGATALSWLGSELSDYGAPLIAPDLVGRIGAADVAAIWKKAADLAGGADVMLLEKEPARIGEVVNPFTASGGEEGATQAYALSLGEDWATFYAALRSSKTRRRMNEKEKKLGKCGDLVFRQVTDFGEACRAIDTIIGWKIAQVRARGRFNPFRGVPLEPVFGRLLGDAPDLLRIYSLDLDGEMLAGCIALIDRDVFTLYQTAYDNGEYARYSPGRILIHRMMEASIEMGLSTFDFSLGDEGYKLEICDRTTPMMRTSRSFTARGWLPGTLQRQKNRLKIRVKASPRLLEGVEKAIDTAKKLGFDGPEPRVNALTGRGTMAMKPASVTPSK